jgi:hypothetical protein
MLVSKEWIVMRRASTLKKWVGKQVPAKQILGKQSVARQQSANRITGVLDFVRRPVF